MSNEFSGQENVMPQRKPRYPLGEFRRRGEEIFERKVRALVEDRAAEDFVAIDIESEEFEVDSDELAVTDRLFARVPTAQPWIRRVGSTITHSFVPTGHATFRKVGNPK